ncbi:hypothetical protein C5F49_00380 [Nitrosopumilus oxyclinae]|uniref:Uncharacterized protein n=1 Tax=Nitrosopumilus oxyclinae TaxID=1959104 RepID=A0A7D5M4A4_9ARCH|nr:hypothetical protein [Nitrosopumilus oxyclinae]QLH03948.1 hypothetical protein C5F49_00380 [Nitrosopumilus oxyclinae]
MSSTRESDSVRETGMFLLMSSTSERDSSRDTDTAFIVSTVPSLNDKFSVRDTDTAFIVSTVPSLNDKFSFRVNLRSIDTSSENEKLSTGDILITLERGHCTTLKE